jgi:hypothetical protein
MCDTENRVYLAQVDSVARTVLWTRPDCHLWSCEDCAEINKRRWTAIVAHGIEEYQAKGVADWRFVTITSNGKLATFNQTLWVWREAWPKLYARMKRSFPAMKYVYLPEKHQNGRLHMHGIMSAGMSTRWLKDNAPYCGFGYKSESEEILSVPLACFYVLKYVTKSLTERAYWPKSLHRVRTSQKWPKSQLEPFVKDLDGIWKTISATEWLERSAKLIREGYEFTNVKTGERDGVSF